MAGYKVSVGEDLLPGLLSGQDGLAKLVETVLNQILEAQVTEALGAERFERTEERAGYRNGTRLRTLYTRVGPVTLQVPQTRDGSFSTEIFKRYQRSEQAFVLALMEMVVQGVSTRKVTAITEELCGASFSKSTVSALCAGLDARVTAFNERRLEGNYPFVLVDALFLKRREGDRVVSRAALVVSGNKWGQTRYARHFTVLPAPTFTQANPEIIVSDPFFSALSDPVFLMVLLIWSILKELAMRVASMLWCVPSFSNGLCSGIPATANAHAIRMY